tara:strand:+ start:1367 stop:2227 length:861 start_codon:yes stop_codon:yes gene_type:complete
MTRGILIYAHNNRTVDYALMAIISGGLAKKQLMVPASLVTDQSTVDWLAESNMLDTASAVFENIIVVDRPQTDNQRRLHDGESNMVVPFINSNRGSAWDLTPYDRTLLIDSDFLIFSNRLSEYWNVDADVLIGESINDIYGQERLGYNDVYISEVGVKLYWATTVMFSKTSDAKLLFDTVNFVKEHYQYYADIFRFDSRQFRNDIAFSVAKHILGGFEEDENGILPPVLSLLDKDVLHEVNGDRLTVLVSSRLGSGYCAAALSGVDVHVMNKQSIIRNKDKLLELI